MHACRVSMGFRVGSVPLEEEMQRHRKRGVTLGPEMAQQVKHEVCQRQNSGTSH